MPIPTSRAVVLTTEEEGIALAAGAWLGGERAVLLMQSSGVGNCVNMLSLPANCRMPLLALVTMRGEWGEFNPWQVPMGRPRPAVLEAWACRCSGWSIRGRRRRRCGAAALAFDSAVPVAVLLAQRLIGAKVWVQMSGDMLDRPAGGGGAAARARRPAGGDRPRLADL